MWILKSKNDWHLVTYTEIESGTRKLPISFRFTFYMFFFLLRSNKTCNFHPLQPVMYERGYKFSSVEAKQVMGRGITPGKRRQPSPPPSALLYERWSFSGQAPNPRTEIHASLKWYCSLLFPWPTSPNVSLIKCLSRSMNCKEKKEADREVEQSSQTKTSLYELDAPNNLA